MNNENIVLESERLFFVPYQVHHVPKYHQWLESPFLLEMTASEPLTIEQEYKNQISWKTDPTKCTFIILLKKILSDGKDEVDAMIGDINFFSNQFDDDNSAELELMIANEQFWNKGLGSEAAMMMMRFGSLSKCTAKISEKNAASINLFTKKLGFQQVSYSSAFKEYTFERQLTDRVLEFPYKAMKLDQFKSLMTNKTI